ncbi:MAG: ABC transporter ATP-binding protein [Lachnospiraceae bacterium]|jgi:putative ABC transport system ATP-binding protein|nr:ABC transporter ATP-binding protein [Lachnospiraceae bacterium]MCI1727615.1 ABC transporter ATP-binding protein [Lachnospiraceae bacterium]
MDEETVLRTIGLGKTYYRKGCSFTALENVSISIRRGEFVSIMGPSGAGKSTLLNIMATIDCPTEGRILIDGRDVSALKADELAAFRREKLGFIFQDYNLLDQMNIYENLTLPVLLSGKGKEEQMKRAQELAGVFRIEKLLDKYPAELSGGEKQRVTAARAIIMNPSIVFADEPTGALDSASARGLLEILTYMNKEQKVTIVLVTHDPFAAGYSSRMIRIRDGRIEAGGQS